MTILQYNKIESANGLEKQNVYKPVKGLGGGGAFLFFLLPIIPASPPICSAVCRHKQKPKLY